MNNTKKAETTPLSIKDLFDIPIIDGKPLDFADMPFRQLKRAGTIDYRFYQIIEIAENDAFQYRAAMENVISCLSASDSSLVYLLSGKPSGVSLYIGIADSHKALNNSRLLKHAFEGNFLGAQLQTIKNDDEELLTMFSSSQHLGLVTGVPAFNEPEQSSEKSDFQGIERLVNSLSNATWQMAIVAHAGRESTIRDTLSQIYELSTQLSAHTKHSIQQSEGTGWNKATTSGTSHSETLGTSDSQAKGKTKGVSESKGSSDNKSGDGWSKDNNNSRSTSDGTSTTNTYGKSSSTTESRSESIANTESGNTGIALTREHIDKRIEQIHSHLNDTQIDRFRQGLSKGMFRTAIYLAADSNSTYQRLSRSVLSIFQGNKPAFTPLTVTKLPIKSMCLADVIQIRQSDASNFIKNQLNTAIVHSIPLQSNQYLYAATWLNTKELSLLAGMPTLELPGIKIRKSVSFAVNTSNKNSDNTLRLGNIIQNERLLTHKPVDIALEMLNKHVFVTGVTGSGKTTTCMKLLLESNLPFIVIEPAKTEYRALYAHDKDIEYYSLAREDLSTFRLNPFELLSERQNLMGHISMLKATMTAVFPMEASMPFIIENAIIAAYQEKGWDIATNSNYLVDNPWTTLENIYPTFSEVIDKLEVVIKDAGMGQEFEEKYLGSLVSRLTSLTTGIKGTMINTPRSINFDKLLDKKVVIELEELKDEEDKAFFMGLILGRLAESIKQRYRKQPKFQHMTLVEEAHRLLTRPEPGSDGSKKLGVEMFANMLAEVRKYGESLVIADQIPNKLVVDVIKNTNIKIIHQLFAADDRNIMGDAMGLNDEQKDFLPMLQPGETVIYCGGWHAPVRAQIDKTINTNAPEIDEDDLKEKGRTQLWSQRTILYPLLSQHSVLDNQAIFSQFIAQARRAVNMLIGFSRTLPHNIKTTNDLTSISSRIAAQLSIHIKKMIASFNINNNDLALMLFDLILDSCALVIAEKTQDVLKEYLPVLVQALSKDESQFLALICSNSINDMPIKMLFEKSDGQSFRNLNTI